MQVYKNLYFYRFCELRSGLLNEEIAARYLFLRSEAHQVDKQLQLMAEKISEADEEEMEDAVVGSIADLNSKLEQIQQDVEIILNPSTRFPKCIYLFLIYYCTHSIHFIGCFFSAPKSPA